MVHSLLLGTTLSLPVLPGEAALVLTLAAGVLLMTSLGPAEPPPSEAVATEAVFALHGYV